jgi:eukaryotic-like serine/threonine-protein kinase
VSAARPWSDTEAALDAILALPQREWTAACARLAGGDDAFRGELQSLLSCVGGFDPVLDRAASLAPLAAPPLTGNLPAGTRVGAYRVLELIGVGGMGEVYRAERADGQFEQQVALKLVTREAAAHRERFQAERQILARLEHPGIARLLDAGLTGDQRPYMVMELVTGQPLLQWCQERHCDLPQRLRLFMAICDAVAYAHRNLIVHRDLKPANVLVSHDGVVKLLDFGVAKLLEKGKDEPTRSAPLTPGYAAPEQLTLGTITTATDVYALGLLLYELLSGDRPWHFGDLPLAAGLEKILRETAPRLSEAAARNPDAPLPAALLRGDLDAIVAKCLRKEPEHRYDSVAALQRDIARFDRLEPVEARAHARLYVLGRWFERHRVAAATAAFVFAIILAAAIAVLIQAHRATREAARATATRDFLVSVFSASDPRHLSPKPRGEITARELLDANAGRIEKEFAADPQTEIELLGIISAIYRELGELDRYTAMHGRMLELARREYGPLDRRVLDMQLDEAELANAHESFPAAAAILDRLDPLIRRARLDGTAVRARWYLLRGMALSADPAAQEARSRALESAADLFGAVAPSDRYYVTTLSELGTLRIGNQQYRRGADYFRRAIETARHVRSPNYGELGVIYSNLALAQSFRGDFQGADRSYTQAEAIGARTYGLDDHYFWVTTAQHARMLHLYGERERALTLFRRVMARLPPAQALDHDAAVVRESYGECLAAEGRATLAIPLLESAVRTYDSKSAFPFESVRARLYLGAAYEDAGRTDEARATLQAVLAAHIGQGAPDSQVLLAARERWGRFLLTHADPAGAVRQFHEVISQDHGRHLSHVALAYGGLARAALMEHRVKDATSFARAGVDLFAQVEGWRDVRMGPYLWRIYAQALLAAGDMSAARGWAQRAVAADRQYDDPSSPELAAAVATLRSASLPAGRISQIQAPLAN